MTKTGQNELELLRRYRMEVDALDKPIAEMTLRRQMLEAAITGLRGLLRNQGLDDAVIDAESDPRLVVVSAPVPTRRSKTIEHTVNVLLNNPRDLGVKEIQEAMQPVFRIDYWALSKALNREASRPHGRIAKVGKLFRVRG